MNEIIALSTKEIVLKRNDFLNMGNSVDQNLYYVESGSLRIFITSSDQEEQTIRLAFQGNIIAALDSFLTGQPSKYHIQALKKCILQVIPKSEINRFLEKTENQLKWITILEGLVTQQLEREIDLLTHSPLERYQRILKRSPRLFQEIPHKHIANYLRMTPETLSRLKSIDFNQV